MSSEQGVRYVNVDEERGLGPTENEALYSLPFPTLELQ